MLIGRKKASDQLFSHFVWAGMIRSIKWTVCCSYKYCWKADLEIKKLRISRVWTCSRSNHFDGCCEGKSPLFIMFVRRVFVKNLLTVWKKWPGLIDYDIRVKFHSYPVQIQCENQNCDWYVSYFRCSSHSKIAWKFFQTRETIPNRMKLFKIACNHSKTQEITPKRENWVQKMSKSAWVQNN